MQIQTAEESVALRLDTSRNQLLVADTTISIVTLAFTIGSFVGSIFGMNLNSYVQTAPYNFAVVCVATSVFIICFSACTIKYFQMTGVIPRDDFVGLKMVCKV